MGALRLLNAVKANVEAGKPHKKELMCVDVHINGETIRAMVDIGTAHNFILMLEKDLSKNEGRQFKS